MPRVVSFIVLLAVLLLMGAVFFQVIAQFVVPLFLAAVLVVIFKPLYERIRRRIPNSPRAAALTTTMLILLVALLPTAWLGWNSYLECRHVYDNYLSTEPQRIELQKQLMAKIQPTLDSINKLTFRRTEPKAKEGEPQAKEAVAKASSTNEQQAAAPMATTGEPTGATETAEDDKTASEPTSAPISQDWGGRIATFVGGMLLNTVQALASLAIGLAIMTIALYYFFLDGPSMISAIMRMSPIDDVYERELLDKFATVSRAVVVASLASAVAQGLLAGIGYYFALNSGAPIFLLTMVTMLLAIVPFVGAAAVWVPTALWIYMFQSGTGDAFWAIALAIYGAVVVSGVDNLIKPMVLHGQSNLHPLLALISVLGGVQVLGPIGILVGPMLVAFFQALVNMVNKELVLLGDSEEGEPTLLEELKAAVSSEESAPSAKPAAVTATKTPTAKKRGPRRRKRSS